MARSSPARAGSSVRRLLEARAAPCISLLAAALAAAMAPSTACAAPDCAAWHAELLGVEGTVTVRRAGTAAWAPAADHTELCFGDSVRSESFSRATVVLPDDTMLRLDQLTTMTLDDPPSGFGTLVDLLLGALHIMSRDPRSLTIKTPHVNAGLEGTEFDIRIAESQPETDVVVLEGAVRVTNATGVVSVPSGNVAAASVNGTPVIRPTRAIDLMRWASYYEPLFAGELPSPTAEPTAAEASDPAFFARRAAARLRFGRLDAASSDLASLRAIDPNNALGHAIEAVIALARGDQAAALVSAKRAQAVEPSSVPALLALAYAQEAAGDLAAAARNIDAAISLEPRNPLAWTRRSELEIARGDGVAALASAEQAAGFGPGFAGAYTALGFAHLSRPDTQRAIGAFDKSIALDQSAPLPHLGLGLALLGKGARRAGRQQLEIATTLDPADGLIRAYLSKAYDTEHRSKLTASQVELAKAFDPADPTGWLYEALGTRDDNRPIAGLESLRAASSLNGNRPPFRSRLFVDEDLATRSTGANSRVYRELGFERLGLLQGLEATAADPSDYSGHRLLSGLYSQLPRGEIARVSEVLLAKLLEPATLAPVQPQLAQPSLFIADSVGPRALASTDLAPVITENGLRFQASVVGGANNTYGDDVAVSGLHDRTSFSVGQYRWRSDGFRANNDIDQRIANAELKFRATPSTTVLAELRSSKTETGYLPLTFDGTLPPLYESIRTGNDTDSLRVGVRHQQGEDDTLIASLVALRDESVVTGPVNVTVSSRSHGLDLQQIHRTERWRLQTGIAYRQRDASSGDAPSAIPEANLDQAAVYTYAQFDVSRALRLTLGASVDSVDALFVDEHSVNPKLGFVWRPADRVAVRAAFFDTLEGSLTSSKSTPQPRLEPTEIAGFTQFLFAANGEQSSVAGVGVDVQVAPRAFVGAEHARRESDLPVVLTFPPPLNTVNVVADARDETQDRAYMYWTPTQKISFSAEYQYDRMEDRPIGTFGFTRMKAQRLPVELRYFGTGGLTAGLRASLVKQEGEFQLIGHGEDAFTVMDASIGYRLPKRRGVLSLNVDNLFDESFRFQDIDPENPSIMPERMAYLRFTFAFD